MLTAFAKIPVGCEGCEFPPKIEGLEKAGLLPKTAEPPNILEEGLVLPNVLLVPKGVLAPNTLEEPYVELLELSDVPL